MSGQLAFQHFPGTAYFTIRDGRITGWTGCNEFQGTATHTGANLTAGELSTIRKACAGDAAELEQALLSR
jgi:heat shock protein HslJ